MLLDLLDDLDRAKQETGSREDTQERRSRGKQSEPEKLINDTEMVRFVFVRHRHTKELEALCRYDNKKGNEDVKDAYCGKNKPDFPEETQQRSVRSPYQ